MVNKKELLESFTKDWKVHYNIETLKEMGFKRQRCKKCGRYFWSVKERDYCGDPACIGYEFIGKEIVKQPLSYIETWKKIEKYFVDNGHTSIKPYPTVARWRDDLYFTIASINDFQPYVVNGELEPIANPLVVPQPCIRFNDIANVGVTGRHYTNFVMIGQHAFNTEKTGLFYWKDEAIKHDINYMLALGIPLEEIVFHEDVWAGGGNFGPSMEYFVGGLELGNVVFMQYEELPDGSTRELKTKVIDMGAGLSRLAWITHGSPTSYEIVFGKAVEYLKSTHDINIDKELYLKYVKMAGSLNIDEVDDIEKEKEKVAKALNVDKDEFFSKLEPLHAIYAIADHSLTLLFTIRDGMMPSNSGGGYNLRMIARRMFAFEDEFNLNIDYYKLLRYHMEHQSGLFDDYKEAIDVVGDVINEEKKKYKNTKEKAHSKVVGIIKKKGEVSKQDLITLYKSHGIPPEYVEEIGRKEGVHIQIPGNFYELIREKDVKHREKEDIDVDVSKYPPTEKLYYKFDKLELFEANVIGIEGNYIILDRTFFYPEGGGQAGDSGWINDKRVIDTKKKNNVILHVVENTEGISIGDKVVGRIDLDRRMDITRHHTVTHLVTAAARKILGKHVWQAGAKKDENKAHIDLTHYKRISDDEIKAIEKQVNKWIMENHSINVFNMPRNKAEEKYGFTIYQGGAVPGKELRIVEIEGIDVEACGGTHHMLKRTGDIGPFKIVRRESVKDGVERLVYKSGLKAVEYIQYEEDLLKNAAEKLRVQTNELPKTVERFFNEWKALKKENERLMIKYLESIMLNNGIHVVKMENIPKIKPGVSLGKGTVIIFSKNGQFSIIGRSGERIMEIIRKYGGRGGGKDGLFNGFIEIDKIDNVIKEIDRLNK